jgi:DNA-binding response OmpR family regulator
MENLDFGLPGQPSNFPRILSSGPITIDIKSRQTKLNNRIISIPPCAFDFLVTLMRHFPEPVSYKTLVFESRKHPLTQLDAQDLARLNIYMLRRALETDIQRPRYILTVAGYGYRLSS